MNFSKILVVCAGNICRSPMGEFFLKKELDGKGFSIESAGIVGLTGHPANETAIKVMNDIGIDMSSHVAKKINAQLLSDYELILVMENKHVKDIEQQYPFTKGRVFRISHWLDKDVADPYKHPEQAFIDSRDLIQQSVSSWIEKFGI